jgi:hypothetical protein
MVQELGAVRGAGKGDSIAGSYTRGKVVSKT